MALVTKSCLALNTQVLCLKQDLQQMQDQGVGQQMAELLSQVDRLRVSSEQCNVAMQSRMDTLDAKLKACEGMPSEHSCFSCCSRQQACIWYACSYENTDLCHQL